MTKQHQNVSIVFDSCEIVRRCGRDHVYFEISKKTVHGTDIEHLQNLHNGFDQYNDRSMTIETVSGNGPKLARLLGWSLRISIIAPEDKVSIRKYVESWDFDCIEKPVQLFDSIEDLAKSGYVFRITDNGGTSIDRYTILFCDGDYLNVSAYGHSSWGEGLDPLFL